MNPTHIPEEAPPTVLGWTGAQDVYRVSVYTMCCNYRHSAFCNTVFIQIPTINTNYIHLQY